MLTPENIATLRRAAYRSQSQRTDEPRAVVTFSGPVVSMYGDAGHGRRVFESVARVGF